MLTLRQSTASQEILLGPFVDDADGKTAETGLTIANTDIKLFKHGGTTLPSKNSGGATHISDGYYYATLDATDTATVGMLVVLVSASGALPVRHEFQVVEEAIYDKLFASGGSLNDLTAAEVNAEVDTALSDYDAATGAELSAVDGKIDTIDSNVDAVLVDTGTTLPAQITGLNDPSAAAIADAVWDELVADHSGAGSTGAALAAAGGSGDPWATALPGAYGAGTAGNIIGNNLDAAIGDLNDVSAADVADAVWDEPYTGHTGAGSFGADVRNTAINVPNLMTTVGNQGDNLQQIPWNSDWDAEVQSEVADALAVYDPPTKAELDSGLAAIDSKIDTIDGVADAILVDTGTTLPATLSTIEGKIDTIDGVVDAVLVDTGTTLPASLTTIDTEVGVIDGVVDAILVDTAELQGDWANGGRLDNLLDTAAAGGGGDATEAKQDTIISSLAAAKGTGFNTATDSLEAIRNRGDAAWVSGAGGSGSEVINQDYGGTDALAAVDSVTGDYIDDMQISAYLKSEYDAGTFTLRGKTTTQADGSWSNPLMLDPATYTLVYYLAGKQTATQEITVT